jgi:hypothetical protein
MSLCASSFGRRRRSHRNRGDTRRSPADSSQRACPCRMPSTCRDPLGWPCLRKAKRALPTTWTVAGRPACTPEAPRVSARARDRQPSSRQANRVVAPAANPPSLPTVPRVRERETARPERPERPHMPARTA